MIYIFTKVSGINASATSVRRRIVAGGIAHQSFGRVLWAKLQGGTMGAGSQRGSSTKYI